MNWRRILHILVPILMGIWTIQFIIEDRALLAASFAFVLSGNLMIDLVEWADRRKRENDPLS